MTGTKSFLAILVKGIVYRHCNLLLIINIMKHSKIFMQYILHLIKNIVTLPYENGILNTVYKKMFPFIFNDFLPRHEFKKDWNSNKELESRIFIIKKTGILY